MSARTPNLPGIDPAWSRTIDIDGVTMHVLERPAQDQPRVTLLAVHGNPTWSYLWRRLLDVAPLDWRVIAVDQIGMGYSDRPDGMRRLADRVADLGRATEALEVKGPVVTVAHDWGGPVSLGWALAHRDMLAGVVLANTAVHQPPRAPAPTLIRLARSKPLLDAVTRRTTTFLRGTTLMSRDMSADVARAFRAPYADASRRGAIRDFVADIPLSPEHPSAATLDAIAQGIESLDVPVLLAWGSDDPVFSDRYLRDLHVRMPHADIHRYEKARHLVTEDAPSWFPDVLTWISHRVLDTQAPPSPEISRAADVVPMGHALEAHAGDPGIALADLRSDRRVTWAMLATRTREIAAGLVDMGVKPGDRIALLVTPSADLIACVYAAWRIGAVVVVADSGLGVRGMRRALRSAEATHVVGIPAGLGLARTLDLPGVRILVGRTGPATRVLGADASLAEVARRGREYLAASDLPSVPTGDADALVAFTSGATGPSKGVVYTHARLAHLRDALRSAYSIGSEDALVAAFAPWSVLGPALGIPSAIPDMDLTDASTLTARALADATAAVGGTLAWASPTAVRAVVASGDALDQSGREALAGLHFLLVAGAPVPVELLERAAALLPAATLATPYGMTEALPLTEVTLGELREASGHGVLVGRPLDGVDIAIAPLDHSAVPADDTVTAHDVTGEIVVRCAWMRDRYDRRWATQHRADAPKGWHRTGDVGHFDEQGRLWVEGRLAHVLTCADGPVTPVAAELAAQREARVPLAALVGVGPAGAQVPVAVLLAPGPALGLADVDITTRVRSAVREATGLELAAVLTMRSLPVDVRHRSKVDRTRIAREAADYLAGERARG
jgi:acyl-coenzyme A synthetase/AMP-(fatty) acid ligase/pimeloyl-ACP methyl ester carboxylesterase